jgi:hypothetical protein
MHLAKPCDEQLAVRWLEMGAPLAVVSASRRWTEPRDAARRSQPGRRSADAVADERRRCDDIVRDAMTAVDSVAVTGSGLGAERSDGRETHLRRGRPRLA